MKIYLPILILFLCHTLAVMAQTPFCATDEHHLHRLVTDPTYQMQFQEMQEQIYNYSLQYYDPHNPQAGGERDVTVLPVVVHIVSPPGTPVGSSNNITDAEVQLGLQYLNDAFANSGAFYSPDGVNTDIQFCLAQRDPLGLPTNGIMRHSSSLVAQNNCTPAAFNMPDTQNLLDIDYWDCCQYINVYLVTDINDPFGYGCSVAGYATLSAPCAMQPYLVQESRYWNSLSDAHITAHEMGHYLGLWHTFQAGCANDNCLAQGDQVCDTPPDNATFSACNANTCNTDADDNTANNPLNSNMPDDTQNFMDYSTCTPFRFTQGQKVRMNASLAANGVYACLLNSAACMPSLNRDLEVLVTAENTPCDENICLQLTLTNRGATSITNATINYQLSGQGSQAYNYAGNLSTNQSVTVDLPCATLGAGSYTVSITSISINGQSDEYPENNLPTLTFSKYEAVHLSLASLDSTNCGNNGVVVLQVQGGDFPFQYRKNGTTTWQISPTFSDLTNENYTFYVQDGNGCVDSLNIALPDYCPPCISGIINKYTPVTFLCSNSVVEVGSSQGFYEDDKVLIIQMQGATISLNNDPTFGDILDYGNAGNYEFNRIHSIDGNTITLEYQLTRTYDTPGKVQLIRVPEYEDITVCNLTCLPWNGTVGGVLTFDASGTVTMAGNIDVSGKGFRGGQVEHIETGGGLFTDYFTDNAIDGAKKGEGIALYVASKEYARGKQANGGGGGGNHNTGGGGGGNGGVGGLGGVFSINSMSEIQTANVRGLGGIKLDIICDKLYMGGGGGAGHSNTICAAGTSGGNGGGIIMVNSQQIINVTGTMDINSNGNNANTTIGTVGSNEGCDGAGGGGGGGSIFLKVNNSDPTVNLSAKGGKGGDINWVSTSNIYPLGNGGGGSGGVVFLEYSTNDFGITVDGGNYGVNLNINPMANNGATAGEQGLMQQGCTMIIDTIPVNQLKIDTIIATKACNGALGSFTIQATGGTPPYQYQLDTLGWQNSNVFNNLDVGVYLLSVRDACGAKADTINHISTGNCCPTMIATPDSAYICSGDTIQLQATIGFDRYIWSPTEGLSDTSIANPIAFPTDDIDYIVEGTKKGVNLIINGDFEGGNVGFSSDYTYANSNTDEGQYKVASNPQSWNGGLSDCSDHTIGGTQMLLLNGSPVNEAKVWYQIVSVEQNTDYEFSTWVQMLSPTNPAKLKFYINGNIIGDSIVASLPTCNWQQFFTIWNSGNDTTADIAIVNQNLIDDGNDFALDDLSFSPICISRDTVHIKVFKANPLFQQPVTCTQLGKIVVEAQNGTLPYEYQLNGGVWQNNGTFDSLNTGNYSITVRDANGCEAEVNAFIAQAPTWNIVIDSLMQPTCTDTLGAISVSINNPGAFYYQYILDSILVQPNGWFDSLIAGTHTIEVIDDFGCRDSIMFTIISPPNNNCNDGICGNGQEQWNSNTCACETAPGSVPVPCTDDGICANGTEIWDAATCTCSQINIPIETNCNDNDCNTADTYNEATCECEHSLIAPPNCDDNNPNTQDLYDEATCTCLHEITEPKAIIPNNFSPNGDGVNDIIKVLGSQIAAVEFKIYNRWGQLVFESTSKEMGWDGRFNGNDQEIGIYAYFLQVHFNSGESQLLQGNITLIR